MTWLQGYLRASYDELVQAFGAPKYGPDADEDKVTCEWVLELDGESCTIYDWKEYRTPRGQYQWHIGGRSGRAVGLVEAAFDRRQYTEVLLLK